MATTVPPLDSAPITEIQATGLVVVPGSDKKVVWGHGPDDDLKLSPNARALRTGQIYGETAGSTAPVANKLAIFRERFHPEAEFEGPIFGHLTGRQVYGKLAFEHGGSAKIQYQPVTQQDVAPLGPAEIAAIDPSAKGEQWHRVTLHWKADYALGSNPIHNEVTTTLVADERGKIRRHTDTFDWKKWMDQAVPAVPRFIRHSGAFRALANFGLGLFTFFKG